jgi:hypothetical protein
MRGHRVQFVADQLKIKDYESWRKYFNREPTRREHLLEIQNLFGFKLFNNIAQQQGVKPPYLVQPQIGQFSLNFLSYSLGVKPPNRV